MVAVRLNCSEGATGCIKITYAICHNQIDAIFHLMLGTQAEEVQIEKQNIYVYCH
jgi:hypothetical protein